MRSLDYDLNDPLFQSHVKFFNKRTGQTHYGQIQTFGEEADKYLPNYVVNDGIFPKAWVVAPADLTPVNMDDYYDYVEAECEKAYAQNEKNGFKVAAGTVFSVLAGDGAAHYVITKVNTKTCAIEWRGYGLDNWYDRVLGIGGTFPINRIEPLIVKRAIKPLKRLHRFDGKPTKEI